MIFENRIRRFSSVARRCSPSRKKFVVKLLRANGGCLGAGKRRRTWQAAISLGEVQTTFDPGISEWGNPPRFIARYPLTESIGRRRLTRGTETSNYPEEKKAIRDSVSSGERKRNSPNRHGVKPASVAMAGSRELRGGRCSDLRELPKRSLVESPWKGDP